eukprot:TRINITY_DN7935_c0_g1_i9.p1 TRINITY_DN7935_c0_g1~~TRINITY_DN7935_c0_g1_i9.p1  ORF type:complete len:200 (-),score=-24.64 TRINITY_DN7935_c0_g1_i9:202-801(-)
MTLLGMQKIYSNLDLLSTRCMKIQREQHFLRMHINYSAKIMQKITQNLKSMISVVSSKYQANLFFDLVKFNVYYFVKEFQRNILFPYFKLFPVYKYILESIQVYTYISSIFYFLKYPSQQQIYQFVNKCKQFIQEYYFLLMFYKTKIYYQKTASLHELFHLIYFESITKYIFLLKSTIIHLSNHYLIVNKFLETTQLII